ncbi:MAG: cytochrome c biogenesis CcdA family protein [Acidimicrobiia bacterium]
MTTDLDRPDRVEQAPESADPPLTAPARRSTRQVLLFAAVLLLLSAAALILLMTVTSGPSGGDDVQTIGQTEVADILLRSETRDDLDLELLYSPSWYFEWAARDEPATNGEPTLAFFMFETVHEGELEAPPAVALVTEAGFFPPSEILLVSDAPHHRVQQLLFLADSDGQTVIEEGVEPLVVVTTDTTGYQMDFEWEQPMPNGLGVLNTTSLSEGFRSSALSMGAIVAIFGGMLTALSPCLLLLAAYYTAVLSGTAAATSMDRARAERQLLKTGLFFVGGFTAVYTAGGVVAGYVGENVQRFESVGDWARPVSIIAGIAVVILGVRMAATARVPIACKLPGFNRPMQQEGWMGSALMGSTFAVGCLSCFSATVLTALLIYAGAAGSPIAGGLVMFMFSAGVGVMFLVAAILVARAAPLATWLSKAQPVIGGVSAAVMIFFGVLMITYKFHEVTGYLFQLWS